jgi:N-carbamoylputrescine amidase
LSKVAKENEVALVVSLFERRRRRVSQHCAFSTPTARSSANTARCTFRTTAVLRKVSISRRAISGFPNFDTKYGRVGVQICWDQWYPEGSRLDRVAGRTGHLLSDQHRLAPEGEKTEFGAAQLDAWRTIQRAHAIATVHSLPW